MDLLMGYAVIAWLINGPDDVAAEWSVLWPLEKQLDHVEIFEHPGGVNIAQW